VPFHCRRVARAGYQVFSAFDGDEAIEQALATPPDVAVIDLVMPTVGGLDVIRALRGSQGHAVHLIAATANDSEEIRLARVDAGADDFLVKPTTTVDLQMRIVIAARKQQTFVEALLWVRRRLLPGSWRGPPLRRRLHAREQSREGDALASSNARSPSDTLPRCRKRWRCCCACSSSV